MKKFVLFLLLLIMAAVIGIYTYLDVIVERAIEKYGTESLGVSVRVGSVNIGSKFDSIIVRNLTIANPEGFKDERMIHIGNINITADLFSVISNPLMNIDDININNLTVNYHLNEAGEANFAHFKKDVHSEHIQAAQKSNDQEKKVAIKKLSITNLTVNAEVSELVKKQLTLKNIEIEDIGVSRGGVTVSNALEQVVDALSKAIAEANLANLINQLLNLKDIKDAVNPKELLDNGVKGLGNTLDGMFGNTQQK